MVHAKHLFSANKCLSDRLQCYLTSTAQIVTDPTLPGGCFVCISTSEVSGTCIPVEAKQTILKINEVTKSSLTAFFNSEIAAGNVNSERSADMMANYI